MYALFTWRIHSEHKAALLCAWFLVFFFAYGHVYNAIWGMKLFGFMIGRHRFLFPLWLAVFGTGGWLLYKKTRRLKAFSRVMNIVSIILLVVPAVQIGAFEWQRSHLLSGNGGNMATVQWKSTSVPAGPLPDVYYIILDQYSRDDILLKNYNLDISAFIHQLEETGFYVPRCSQSNYGSTLLSVPSSLNMNFVDQILPDAIRRRDNEIIFSGVFKHSLVRQLFEGMGYKTVSFDNGIWWSEWTDADYYITNANGQTGTLANFSQTETVSPRCS